MAQFLNQAIDVFALASTLLINKTAK